MFVGDVILFLFPFSIFVPQLCYQDMIVKQGLADLESFAFLLKSTLQPQHDFI